MRTYLSTLMLLLSMLLVGCGTTGDPAPNSDEETGAAEQAVPGGLTTPGYSQLWGQAGELWNPRGRLPDFSWAGYHGGERPIPNVPVVASVRDFGARGDGVTDDTAAFVQAIAATQGGALLIPRGRYRLSNILKINKSNLVLRGEGAGPDGTVLLFTKNLLELSGLSSIPSPNTISWSGGMIRIEPLEGLRTLTTVTASSSRGSRTLMVGSASALRPGMMVVLRLTDDSAQTLQSHIYSYRVDPDAIPGNCGGDRLDWPVEIEAVSGNLVTLKQPLRTDVRLGWTPKLYTYPALREVGIEDLRFEFPSTPYPGHHLEHGYNAIDFEKDVVNGWVRNVHFHNADSGVLVNLRCKWITIDNFAFTTARAPDSRGRTGHHGVALSRTADTLVTRFDFRADLVHELTITHQASGNVFSSGRGTIPIDLDHHRDWPFENLFTAIATPTRYQESGDLCYGPNSAARGTFWNLAAPMSVPSWGYVQTNVIGALGASVSEKKTASAEWYERIPVLAPANLHEAQLARRLAR